MQVKFVVVAGAAKTQEIRLRLPAVLGRGRACSVQLPHPLVSRQHCEVFEAENKLFVRDLGSLNGTLVDGQKISEAEIHVGQQLTIGSLTFRVELGDTVAEPAPRRRPTVTTSATVPTPGAAATLRPSAPPAAVPMTGAATKTAGAVRPTVVTPTAAIVPPPPQVISAEPSATASASPPVGASPPLAKPSTPTTASMSAVVPSTADPADEPLADFADAATQDAPRVGVPLPTIAPATESESVAFEPADSFLADESAGEDVVEVVEDAADLLPPAASPLPAASFALDGSEPTAVIPAASSVAPAVATTYPATPPAPPAEPAAAQTAAEEDEDLTAFLKSLGK